MRAVTIWCFALLLSGVVAISIVERTPARNVHDKQVLDYTLTDQIEVPTEEERQFQRDIEDVNGHFILYHSLDSGASLQHTNRINLDVRKESMPKDSSRSNTASAKTIDNKKTAAIPKRDSLQNNNKPIISSANSQLLKSVIDSSRSHTGEASDKSNINKEGANVKGYHTAEAVLKPALVAGGTEGNTSRRLPRAIIIGVKKAGTRALLEFLKMHPDIKAPGPEPHFFDKNYDKGYDWYRSQMPESEPHQLTIEKTPGYFITKECPSRIHNMSADTKLIVVVRDPVTRVISDYTQGLERRPDLAPFEHLAFTDNHTQIINVSWTPIKIGLYIKHLEKWLKFFPLNQIHFVDGEKLITNPASELYKVQQFLAVRTVINDKYFSFNATKGFPCLVKQPGNSQVRPHCLGETKGRHHPQVSQRALYHLREFYNPYNQKLYIKLGRNFGW